MGRAFRTAGFVLVLALGGGACQPVVQEQPSTSWKKYVAPDRSYEVAYPANLAQREFDGSDLDPEGVAFSPESLTGVIFASEGSPSLAGHVLLFAVGGEFNPTELRLGVTVLKGGDQVWKTAKEAAEFFRAANEAFEGYEEVAFRPVEIAGEEGHEVVVSNLGQLPNGNEVGQMTRLAFAVLPDATYAIGGGAFEETYEAHEEVFDRFLHSFHLTEAGGEASASREEVAASIRDRFKALIDRDGLPYRVTRVEFEEATEKDIEGLGLPSGTWLWVQFGDPYLTQRDPSISVRTFYLYRPLELYRDALAPFLNDLPSVSMFILAFEDPAQTVFQIPPHALRAYVGRHLSNREMSREIRITQRTG